MRKLNFKRASCENFKAKCAGVDGGNGIVDGGDDSTGTDDDLDLEVDSVFGIEDMRETEAAVPDAGRPSEISYACISLNP